MMCTPCKSAGRMLTAGVLPIAINVLHESCENPTTCTCQHMLTSMIQKRTDG